MDNENDDIDINLEEEKDEDKMQQGWVGLLKLRFCQHKLQLKEGKGKWKICIFQIRRETDILYLNIHLHKKINCFGARLAIYFYTPNSEKERAKQVSN